MPSGIFYAQPPLSQQPRHGAYPVAPAAYTIPGLAGSLSSNGAAPKTATRILAGSSTPTGVVTKAINHLGLAGSQTDTGTVTPRRVFLVSGLAGSSTDTATLAQLKTVHNATGSQTDTGALTKAITHLGLAGSQTDTGTVSTWKGQVRSFSGSQTDTGICLKQVIKPLSGSLTSNGFGPKTTIRNLTGTWNPTAAMTPARLPAWGQWVSPPLGLAQAPVSGSRVTWTATVPPYTTLTVETSVDNGFSWQQVESGGSIPRLVPGTSVARAVLTRVTMTRQGPTIPTPTLQKLDVIVSVDAGAPELCPLGVFLLDDVTINDSAAGIYLELSGTDLSRKIARNTWDTTYTIQPDTNVADAIEAMAIDRMPEVTTNFVSTTATTPQLQFGQQSSNDPWQDMQSIATGIGCELFFDARGVLTLRPIPDPSLTPSVWEVEDTAHPVMTNLVRSLSDENSFNKVIVTGEGTGNDVPVQAIAVDDDPSSPTYYLGPYGTVTYRYTSSTITTTDQAQTTADGLLLQVKGATEVVGIDMIPMPAIEPGDVITVTRGRTAVAGRFLIDQVSIPLSPADTMHLAGRRQRLT